MRLSPKNIIDTSHKANDVIWNLQCFPIRGIPRRSRKSLADDLWNRNEKTNKKLHKMAIPHKTLAAVRNRSKFNVEFKN